MRVGAASRGSQPGSPLDRCWPCRRRFAAAAAAVDAADVGVGVDGVDVGGGGLVVDAHVADDDVSVGVSG